jgi:hypothetical protein
MTVTEGESRAVVSQKGGTSPGCDNYGSDPCLWALDAMNNSFTAAINSGCSFVETYEEDVDNATQGGFESDPTVVPTPPPTPTP